MQSDELYLGVMSGTSLDAVDCSLVAFNSTDQFKQIHYYSHPIPENYRTQLLSLTQPQNDEIDLLVEMDVKMAALIAKTCLETLNQAGVKASQVSAIGSHGQTIRHYPDGDFRTSLQIGDANIISERTGISTVADFRRRDMAAGGQGAPLVPPFHAAAFQHQTISRCAVNIGGIANISTLPAINSKRQIIGYDTGPGNSLMDLCCQQFLSCQYDHKGKMAASGSINSNLLNSFLKDPYFSLSLPKTTGREYFGRNWLEKINLGTARKLSRQQAIDSLTTLTELTAITISEQINYSIADCSEVIICGGGSQNDYLLSRLKTHLPGIQLKSSLDYGIDSQWIESMAFAWLARQTCKGLAGNLTSVTGASHPVILGAIYPTTTR